MRRSQLTIGSLAVVLAVGVAGCTSSAPKQTTPALNVSTKGKTVVQVSTSSCGLGWTKPHAGLQDFLMQNTDISEGEVWLTNPANGAVYAELDDLGPNTASELTANLSAGKYAFKCSIEDQDPVVGPTITLTGKADPSIPADPAVLPVTQQQLIPPTKQYETYVEQSLPTLVSLVGTLKSDIDGGDLTKARSDWLPAHLQYERLGAAYDAFGDADGAINGTTNGLPDGVQDKDFTGFHRVEYGLWHGQSAAELKGPAADLATAVDGLVKEFPTAQIDPLDMSIRAHEITENALQFELTGETDYGSHSNLATVRANLDGTRQVIAILTPLLKTRYTQLDAMTATLDESVADFDALEHGGVWTPLDSLDTTQRERIDSDISELSEQLAPIASILEPRRTSS